MFEFFDDLAPENEERISDTRADKIKTSVLSRIEEDKPMKKHFSIKPLVVAAAIMTTGALCAVSAGANTNTNISELILPGAGITEPNAVNDSEASYIVSYNKGDWTAADITEPNEVTELDVSYVVFHEKNDTGADNNADSGEKSDRDNCEYMTMTGEVKSGDLETMVGKLLYEESDGTRHYGTFYGGEAVVKLIGDGKDSVRIYFYCEHKFSDVNDMENGEGQ